MMFFSGKSLLVFLLSVFILIPFKVYAQSPSLELQGSRDDLQEAMQWMEIQSYHVAQRGLVADPPHLSSSQLADLKLLLTQATFEESSYEEAYQLASEFLERYPTDGHRGMAHYIRGISAYFLKQFDDALASLDVFLGEREGHPYRGRAFFWRAMCQLELGDWNKAETDLQSSYDDPSTLAYRDWIVMGWALTLERGWEFEKSGRYYEQLINDFPSSELITHARIRLASIALRQGNHKRAQQLLGQVNPRTSEQREEYLLLQAMADFQTSSYEKAIDKYKELIEETPMSVHRKTAHQGIAWSHYKRGDLISAQKGFDSLSLFDDSVGYSSMYQSGALAVLQNNINVAIAKFDTLISKSPYDEYAERAYFQAGMIQYRNKRYRDARRYFQLAARLFPESKHRPIAYRMLGESSVALADFSNAQHAFAQVRRLTISQELLGVAFFQEGICLYHLGRFKSSAEMLNEYLRQFPDDDHRAEGLIWRGEALYQDGRFDEAEGSYADAIRLFPNNSMRVVATYGLAWSLFEQKKFGQAIAAFDRFVDEFPSHPNVMEASLRKADCYFFLGQYEKSAELYTKLTNEKSKGRYVEYAAFQMAMSYVQRGEFERGIEHLRNFLLKFPSSLYNEIVQFNIGWTYFSKDQFVNTITEFQRLIQKYPESQLMPRVYFNLGDAFYNSKQYDSARVYYQRVLKEFPKSLLVADALAGLQYAYEAEGKPAAAVGEIDAFLSSSPNPSQQEELLLRKGDILFGQGDIAGAVLEYQKLLGLQPSRQIQAKVLHQLGRAYEFENNHQRAISYYEQILSDFSDTEVAPVVTLALGITHIKTKQYPAAIRVLQNFVSSFNESPLQSEGMYNLGVAYLHSQKKREALEQFSKVIQNFPSDIFADRSRLQRARLHLSNKEFRASVDTLDDIVKRRNDDLAAEALLMIGENYLSMKKPGDALQAFRDVYEQYTEFPLLVERAWLGAGECYGRLRDPKREQEMYENVVKTAVDPIIRKDAEERLKRLKRK